MPRAVNLSDDLIEAARRKSRLRSRSMAQQIEHWARLGRSLERSGTFSQARVHRALTGRLDFDDLDAVERALVADRLASDVFRPDGDAGLRDRLREQGPLSTVDADGRLVLLHPDGRTTPIDADRYSKARKAKRGRRS